MQSFRGNVDAAKTYKSIFWSDLQSFSSKRSSGHISTLTTVLLTPRLYDWSVSSEHLGFLFLVFFISLFLLWFRAADEVSYMLAFGRMLIYVVEIEITDLTGYWHWRTAIKGSDPSISSLTELRFYVLLDTKKVISDMLFPANLFASTEETIKNQQK